MTPSLPIVQRRTFLIPLIIIIQLILVRNFIQNQCKLFNVNEESNSIAAGAPSTSNSSPLNTHLDKFILPSSTTVPKDGISNILTTTQTSPSFHIFVYPIVVDKYISKYIIDNGIYEGGTTRLVESLLPIKHDNYNENDAINENTSGGDDEHCSIDLVLDLGSNLGYYSLLAASRGYNVISFEASPDTAWLQRSSAALNGWLVAPSYYHSMQDDMSGGSGSRYVNNNGEGSLLLFPVGVSDIPSTGRMSRHSSSPGMTSFATSINNNTAKDQFDLQQGTNGSALDVDIELVRANDVLSELGLGMNNTNINTNNSRECSIRYRLLKIDVEGYEMKALQGLNLNNYPFESIVMEYFPAMLTSAGLERPMELLEYIHSFGYEFYIIESRNGSVKKVRLDDELFSKSWVRNDHVNLLAKKIRIRR